MMKTSGDMFGLRLLNKKHIYLTALPLVVHIIWEKDIYNAAHEKIDYSR